MHWAIRHSLRYRYWLVLAALAAVFFGCLTKQESDTFTLPEKFVDSLSRYDSVEIILKDTSGHTLDTLFHGKVRSADQLKNLPAPHALDGEMLVTLIGYQGGQVAYHVDRQFNGKINQVETHHPIILPNTRLSFSVQELLIPRKTTIPLPIVTVEPSELADKSLLWTSSNRKIFLIGEYGLRGISPGIAYLHVSLKSDTSKHADLPIRVIPNPKLPDSLKITPDTLKIAARGRAGQFALHAFPSTASAVTWKNEDTSIVSISDDGRVRGLKYGYTKVRAVSKEDETIEDSAFVAVSDPITVESVRFIQNTVNLFVGGAAESLMVDVGPPASNPEVAFSVQDSSIVHLLKDRIIGIREGATIVVAKSAENQTKSDSLRVTVYPSQKVDSVRVIPDTLKLFLGGEQKVLQVKVYPSVLSSLIQWRSASPTIATVDEGGKVTPVTQGQTVISVVSRIDSTKKDDAITIVKRDVPQVTVGRDTVISVGQTLVFLPDVHQEYGQVVQFKWDLNGDGMWDDSAFALKSVSNKFDQEKEYLVSFYVRDTEGNDTSVTKRVRAVKGPILLINSPPDNSYTNQSSIVVSWSINGVPQDSLPKEKLKYGLNTILRSAKDEAGKLFSTSVIVYLDTLPPANPEVHGFLLTNTRIPTWTWNGGGGGKGTYRVRLDDPDLSGTSETKETSFIPATELTEGVHTLFVQERDVAGNWSQSGRLATRVDMTPPAAPTITLTQSSPMNNRKPTWNWSSGGSGGAGTFRFRLDSIDLKAANEIEASSFTPGQNLSEGIHTLYLQERDSAGNWSSVASKGLRIDVTPPSTPKISAIAAVTTNAKPSWHWSGDAIAGSGNYRCKLDDSATQNGETLTTDTAYSPTSDLPDGIHTLYVQERDSAGNWSQSGYLAVAIHGQTGYAAGFGGTILKTTNGGISWIPLITKTSQWLFSVHFPDSRTGYAVGAGGAILRTSNGGISWDSLNSHTMQSLRCVHFFDSKNGFAVGDSGTVLKTADGGNSWNLYPIGVSNNFSSVYFSNAKAGFAVGASGFGISTVDGGGFWNYLPRESEESLNSVFFINDDIGFIVGANGAILKTIDGGGNWKKPSKGTTESLNSVHFPDPKIGYASGYNGAILKSIDGGETWAPLSSRTPKILTSIYFTDSNTGYVVGNIGVILKTVDGGVSWKSLSSGTNQVLSSVYFP